MQITVVEKLKGKVKGNELGIESFGFSVNLAKLSPILMVLGKTSDFGDGELGKFDQLLLLRKIKKTQIRYKNIYS